MTAQIIPFPWKHGNPDDPNVETIRQVFAERGERMADEEARTFTRNFMTELERLQRARRK